MTCPPCTHDCNEGRNCPAQSKNEIIEMAQECGLIGMRPHLDGIYSESLEAFAKLVAAAEREACAKVCEELVIQIVRNSASAVDQCAKTIRARGQA